MKSTRYDGSIVKATWVAPIAPPQYLVEVLAGADAVASQASAALQAALPVALSSSGTYVVAQRRASVNGPQPERYTFRQTLEAEKNDDGIWFYKALILDRDAQGPLGWPVMGVVINDKVHSMGQGVDVDGKQRYEFPAGVEAFNTLVLEMRFSELPIANYQNASSQLQVIRNAELSPLAPTRPAFVYQTQWFAFPSLVSPLLSWRDPFPIGAWTNDPATNPLVPVFNALFAGFTANRTISCAIRYGYQLAISDDAKIVPYLPVKFRPKFTYNSATVAEIIAAVESWYREQKPVSQGGEWLFGLNFYSSVDGQLDRPLLELPVFSTLAAPLVPDPSPE